MRAPRGAPETPLPELPEVEAAKRYLESEGLVGRRFTGADLRWPRAVRSGDVEDFVLGITGAAVRGLGRRGKFILIELEEGWLGIHLGMTGSVPIVESAEPRHKFAHNVLSLDDGRELRFVDPRKLGGLWLAGDVEEIAGRLGVEPLGPAFTVETLERLLAGRTAPVKPLLMDQRLIAGVGNIYADEALIRAGVSPLRPAKSLSAADVAGVHAGLVEALELAVARLTSLGTSGKPPTAREDTRDYFLMPRQAGAPCRRCGAPVARSIIRARSAYHCPACQA